MDHHDFTVSIFKENSIGLKRVKYYLIMNSHVNLYPATSFCPKNIVCFSCLLQISKCMSYYSVSLYMETNNINPDQTADLGPYCLHYRLLKNRSR